MPTTLEPRKCTWNQEHSFYWNFTVQVDSVNIFPLPSPSPNRTYTDTHTDTHICPSYFLVYYTYCKPIKSISNQRGTQNFHSYWAYLPRLDTSIYVLIAVSSLKFHKFSYNCTPAKFFHLAVSWILSVFRTATALPFLSFSLEPFTANPKCINVFLHRSPFFFESFFQPHTTLTSECENNIFLTRSLLFQSPSLSSSNINPNRLTNQTLSCTYTCLSPPSQSPWTTLIAHSQHHVNKSYTLPTLSLQQSF